MEQPQEGGPRPPDINAHRTSSQQPAPAPVSEAILAVDPWVLKELALPKLQTKEQIKEMLVEFPLWLNGLRTRPSVYEDVSLIPGLPEVG